MNIQPNAPVSSIAGTSRAAAKGGSADNQAIEATNRQSTADAPGGKSSETAAVDSLEKSGDRDGDGRQFYDRLEKIAEHREDASNAEPPPTTESDPESSDLKDHIDFTA